VALVPVGATDAAGVVDETEVGASSLPPQAASERDNKTAAGKAAAVDDSRTRMNFSLIVFGVRTTGLQTAEDARAQSIAIVCATRKDNGLGRGAQSQRVSKRRVTAP